MRTMTVTIKGTEWRINFYTLKAFLKKHVNDMDGDEFFGITNTDKSIDFVTNKVTLSLIRHEIFHAFRRETNTESVDLNAEDMEELCATLVETHLPDIIQISEKVLTFALDRG